MNESTDRRVADFYAQTQRIIALEVNLNNFLDIEKERHGRVDKISSDHEDRMRVLEDKQQELIGAAKTWAIVIVLVQIVISIGLAVWAKH